MQIKRVSMFVKSHRFRAGWAAVAFVFAVVLSAGCATRSPFLIRPGPVVKTTGTQPSAEALSKVAIMPFYPASPSLDSTKRNSQAREQRVHIEDAALVGRLVSEALVSNAVVIVSPNDFELALSAEGLAAPELDPKVAAEVAARVFGASSVLVGHVNRYQERDGIAVGGTRATSVVFEVSLHDISSGRTLWSGRFAETQQAITKNIFRARDYPGRGTRWLSAAEFARWGADQVVTAMLPAGSIRKKS